MVTKDFLVKAKSFAEKLVRNAGQTLLDSKPEREILKYKDIQDILTNIDLKVEQEIISKIEKNYPDHSIFSEEAGESIKNSDYTWVIDPLDGTKEYVRDIPLYCSAVMLEKNGDPQIAAIYDPELDELYSAGKGIGAYLNGHQIHVSAQEDLKQSMLFTYLPRTSRDVIKLSPLFDLVYRVRGHANHNMSYCWVAKGGYEGHFSLFTPTHWWDIAPGILILTEAGGMVTDRQGQPITHQSYQNEAVGTNGKIHHQLLKAISALHSHEA